MSKMPVRRLKSIAADIYRETELAVCLESILERGNVLPLPEHFSDTHAGYVLVRVREAVVGNLIMAMMRVHDSPDQDRASLPKAFQLLNDPQVFDAVIASEGARLGLQHQGEPSEQVRVFQREWKEFGRRQRVALEKLRGYRNAFLAHNLTSPPNDLPRYDDMFGLLASTRPIVEKLSQVTGVNMNRFGPTSDLWNRRADEFWGALLRGQQIPTIEADG
jgi:hypothetical protein